MPQGTGDKTEERRRHLRIRTVLPLTYRKSTDSRLYEGSTTNLSVEGTAIQTSYPLARDELLEVWMAFGSKPVSFSTEIIHVAGLKEKTLRAGLRFQKVPEGKRRLLKRYLSRTFLETRAFGMDRSLYGMIRHLNSALIGLKLYGSDHPNTALSIQRSYNSLVHLLGQKGTVELQVSDGTLLVDHVPVGRGDILCSRVAEELISRGIYQLIFNAGISQGEFEVLVTCLNQKPQDLISHGGIQKLLETIGVSHLLANLQG